MKHFFEDESWVAGFNAVFDENDDIFKVVDSVKAVQASLKIVLNSYGSPSENYPLCRDLLFFSTNLCIAQLVKNLPVCHTSAAGWTTRVRTAADWLIRAGKLLFDRGMRQLAVHFPSSYLMPSLAELGPSVESSIQLGESHVIFASVLALLPFGQDPVSEQVGVLEHVADKLSRCVIQHGGADMMLTDAASLLSLLAKEVNVNLPENIQELTRNEESEKGVELLLRFCSPTKSNPGQTFTQTVKSNYGPESSLIETNSKVGLQLSSISAKSILGPNFFRPITGKPASPVISSPSKG